MIDLSNAAMYDGACHDADRRNHVPVRTTILAARRGDGPVFDVTCVACGSRWDSREPWELAVSSHDLAILQEQARKRRVAEFGRMLSQGWEPPHWRDGMAPCAGCGERWTGRSTTSGTLTHIPGCLLLAAIDAQWD